MEQISSLNWKAILVILAALVVGYLIGKNKTQKEPEIIAPIAEKTTKTEPKQPVKEAAKVDEPKDNL